MTNLNTVFRDPEAPTRLDILSLMSFLSVKEQHSMGLISDEDYKDFLVKTYDLIVDEYKRTYDLINDPYGILCSFPKEENGNKFFSAERS